MARVGINEAARLAGVAKTTLLRAIKSGKLTATSDRSGKRRVVDTAELQRVYGGSAAPVANGRATGRRTGIATGPPVELVEELRRQVARLEGEVADLKRELAEERNERRHLQSLLHPKGLPAPGGGLLDAVAGWFRR